MQRGFSLVETLIATCLLAAAVVTLAQLLAIGVHAGFSARTRTVSMLLAAKQMEELRGRVWSALDTGGSESREYFDARLARVCGDVDAPCPEASYVSRWSASAASFNPGVLLIEVEAAPVGIPANGVMLTSARARKTP